jgi:hypothetical protein
MSRIMFVVLMTIIAIATAHGEMTGSVSATGEIVVAAGVLSAEFDPLRCATGITLSADRKMATLERAGKKDHLCLASWFPGAASGELQVTFSIDSPYNRSAAHWFGIVDPEGVKGHLDVNGYRYFVGSWVWALDGALEAFDPVVKHLDHLSGWAHPRPSDLLTLIYAPGSEGANDGTLLARINGGQPELVFSGLSHRLLPALCFNGLNIPVSIEGNVTASLVRRAGLQRAAAEQESAQEIVAERQQNPLHERFETITKTFVTLREHVLPDLVASDAVRRFMRATYQEMPADVRPETDFSSDETWASMLEHLEQQVGVSAGDLIPVPKLFALIAREGGQSDGLIDPAELALIEAAVARLQREDRESAAEFEKMDQKRPFPPVANLDDFPDVDQPVSAAVPV